jgi:hypothetical protein
MQSLISKVNKDAQFGRDPEVNTLFIFFDLFFYQ